MKEFDHLLALKKEGFSFETAYNEVFDDNTAYLVEAFELWEDSE